MLHFSGVDLSRTVILSSMLLPPSNAETPQVPPPGGSRRLWNVQSGIDFHSLEFCFFFEPEFCMSVTQHCWVGESFRFVMGKSSEERTGCPKVQCAVIRVGCSRPAPAPGRSQQATWVQSGWAKAFTAFLKECSPTRIMLFPSFPSFEGNGLFHCARLERNMVLKMTIGLLRLKNVGLFRFSHFLSPCLRVRKQYVLRLVERNSD